MKGRKRKTRHKGGSGKAHVRAGRRHHTDPLARVQRGHDLYSADDLLRAMSHTPSRFRVIVPLDAQQRVMPHVYVVCGATGTVTVLDSNQLGTLADRCADPHNARWLRGYAAEVAGLGGTA